MGKFSEADLEGPVQQVIRILDTGDPAQGQFPGQAQVFGQAPGRFIRNTDIPDLAGPDQPVECRQSFCDSGAVLVRGMEIVQASKAIGIPVRPVRLVQIDVIGLQTSQAGVDSGVDIFFIEPDIAIAYVCRALGPGTDLGGNNQLLAVAALSQPVANNGGSSAMNFHAPYS